MIGWYKNEMQYSILSYFKTGILKTEIIKDGHKFSEHLVRTFWIAAAVDSKYFNQVSIKHVFNMSSKHVFNVEN